MREPANREVPGVRKLVLGFDGGCATCSDLAERISQRVGDKLEVRSLHHPQVEHWRERAFGKDAPWTPTLFEVGGVGEVRAWTGAGIPDAAIAKGERAVRKWLSRRLQDDAEGQGRGFWGCVWAVGKFVALNAIPVAKILKIRQAIKALGGVRNFVAIFQYAYRAARKKGYKKWGAVWFAARHVAEVSGVEVASAIAAFFEIDAVWNNCT